MERRDTIHNSGECEDVISNDDDDETVDVIGDHIHPKFDPVR